jgi:hypothetical protein
MSRSPNLGVAMSSQQAGDDGGRRSQWAGSGGDAAELYPSLSSAVSRSFAASGASSNAHPDVKAPCRQGRRILARALAALAAKILSTQPMARRPCSQTAEGGAHWRATDGEEVPLALPASCCSQGALHSPGARVASAPSCRRPRWCSCRRSRRGPPVLDSSSQPLCATWTRSGNNTTGTRRRAQHRQAAPPATAPSASLRVQLVG